MNKLPDKVTKSDRRFLKRGFYLHMCWSYAYPFAVRTWTLADYERMFRLLRNMGYEQVMIWPYTEKTSVNPARQQDREWLETMAKCVDLAHASQLECWLTFAPCLGIDEDEADFTEPIQTRTFFEHLRVYRLSENEDYSAYLKRLEYLIGSINNADGYVFIDTDPGGYPEAPPEAYVNLLHDVREIIDKAGINPRRQEVVSWIWGGWGNTGDGGRFVGWNTDVASYSEPVLAMLKSKPPPEPFQILIGRSSLDATQPEGGHANGRINIRLAEEKSLLIKCTLFTYEIIEFEPSCPAFIVQFDLIRDVIRRECANAVSVRGIFGNAQQPVDTLHNMFFFAKATDNLRWLEKSNDEILFDFSRFVGAAPETLMPALNCLSLQVNDFPENLPEKLRRLKLTSAAQLIPGGAAAYLALLAQFVETRLQVLNTVSAKPDSLAAFCETASSTIASLEKWWELNRYTGNGLAGARRHKPFIHPRLRAPFDAWLEEFARNFKAEERNMLLIGKLANGLRIAHASAETMVADWLN